MRRGSIALGRAALGAAAAVAFNVAGIATGATVDVVRDTWQDNDRTAPAAPVYSEYGTDSDADTDIESAWFNGGTGATATTTPGHLILTPSTSSASWTTYFTPPASPLTLASAGQFMKVTWTFKTGDVNTSNTSQNFRLALVGTPSGSRLAADGAPGSANYSGYALFGNMGETTGNGNSFQLRDRININSDLLSSSGNWTAVANGLGNTQVGYADNTTYTFTLSLTRNASNGLDVLMSMAGGNIGGTGLVSVNVSDPTPATFTYDTFAIRPSNAAGTASFFDTTLFRVETNVPIPEPASAGLLVGALALLRRRR